MENSVSDAEFARLDGGLGAEPGFLSDGESDDSAKAALGRGLRFMGAQEAVQEHGAGMVCWFCGPAEAPGGRGQWLETGGERVES